MAVKKTGSSARVELSPDASAWTTLALQLTAVQSRIDRELQRRARLSLSDFLALHALAGNEIGELRIQEVADAVGLNQSSASRLVTRLQDAGLTERRTCEVDRRGVYTGIRAEGYALLRQATAVYEGALDAALNSIANPKLATALRKSLRLVATSGPQA